MGNIRSFKAFKFLGLFRDVALVRSSRIPIQPSPSFRLSRPFDVYHHAHTQFEVSRDSFLLGGHGPVFLISLLFLPSLVRTPFPYSLKRAYSIAKPHEFKQLPNDLNHQFRFPLSLCLRTLLFLLCSCFSLRLSIDPQAVELSSPNHPRTHKRCTPPCYNVRRGNVSLRTLAGSGCDVCVTQ